MYHEIRDPEQAAELAAGWRQAFQSLERRLPQRATDTPVSR